MDALEVLVDGITRSREVCHEVFADLSPDDANTMPADEHNSISWLVWHIARQQDVQIAALATTEEVWMSGGWYERMGLDLPPDSMGYGHTIDDVRKVRVTESSALLGYLDAAVDATIAYVRSLTESDLDDVIDTRWNPPVTRGVRLVSIVDDAAQHAGQAAYVRGSLSDR